MYDTTAFLYEATAAFEQPDAACAEIHGIFARCGIHPPGLIGDLGAGTGLFSVLLAKRGWRVHGVERSQAMLDEALAKLPKLPTEERARLTFTRDDITAFRLPPGQALDGAICLCNTINHLAGPDAITGFVRATHQALRPGGILIFDSDTQDTFRAFFNHPPTVVWDDGTHRLTRSCAFDEATGVAHHLALLETHLNTHGAAGLRRISEEAMTLQYHPESFLQAAFTEGGFCLAGAKPYNPNPMLYKVDFAPKVLWVWRKG